MLLPTTRNPARAVSPVSGVKVASLLTRMTTPYGAARWAPYMPVWAVNDSFVTALYRGRYKVAGTTTYLGTPVARDVYLYLQRAPTFCLLAMKSDATTGAFAFEELPPGKYLVVGIDPTQGGNDGVIHTWIDAVPM